MNREWMASLLTDMKILERQLKNGVPAVFDQRWLSHPASCSLHILKDEEHHILCHSGSFIRRAPMLRQVRPSRKSTCSSERSLGRYFQQP